MPQKFSEDFYVFLTPKDESNSNSYIKILDADSPFSGVVFVINWIKIRRRFFFGEYRLKYDYSVIEQPSDTTADTSSGAFKNLIGDIIIDIWEKYYA